MKLKKLMKLKEDFIGHLGGILVPFFGSIFDLFLDSALLVRDVFHGVFCDWMGILDPFCPRF